MHPLRSLSLALALGLSGCAGLPVGRGAYVFLGAGVVHIDREAKASAVSSRSIGIALCPRSLTIGVQASFCASLPMGGDVAIIERGSGANQHLKIVHLRKEPS